MKSLLPALALLTWTLGLFVGFDALFAISLSPTWTALAVLVGWAISAAYSSQASRVGFLFLCLLFSGATVGVRWLNENSRKPFLRDFQRLHSGMTRDEVERVMGHYLHGAAGPTLPPGVDKDAAIYRHTNDGWGDADWGVVRFQQDRVVELSFLPD